MIGRLLASFSSYGSYSYELVLHRCLALMHWAVVMLVRCAMAIAQQSVMQRAYNTTAAFPSGLS